MNAPRVLVVEDRAVLRRWLVRVLSGLEIEPREASTAGCALELLRRGRPFELVLVGVGDAPDEALALLTRARTAGIASPFLLLATLPDDALRETVADLGEARVVDLPAADVQLAETVSRALSEGAVSGLPLRPVGGEWPVGGDWGDASWE